MNNNCLDIVPLIAKRSQIANACDDQIQLLRNNLERNLRQQKMDFRFITHSLAANKDESLIMILTQMAQLLYSSKSLNTYALLLAARNALMDEIDNGNCIA